MKTYPPVTALDTAHSIQQVIAYLAKDADEQGFTSVALHLRIAMMELAAEMQLMDTHQKARRPGETGNN